MPIQECFSVAPLPLPAGATPVKLTLAGVIFSMFTTAILVLDRITFDQIRFWTVGCPAGRDWQLVQWMGPLVAVGLLGSLMLSRQIITISLGQDISSPSWTLCKRVEQSSSSVRLIRCMAL